MSDESHILPQQGLFFDGQTYEPAEDQKRLSGQLLRVFDLMRDREWRSLDRIARAVGGSEASVSARLRDLRKPRFGTHTVERQRRPNGVWIYRLEVNPTALIPAPQRNGYKDLRKMVTSE